MALPLREGGAGRNLAALPALARNGEKRGRSERAEEVTKRALEKCCDGSCGGAESSVRIPLFRRFILSCNPSAKQQRPEGDRSWENEQTKCRAAASGLGIDALHSDRYVCDGKGNTEKRIKIECANQQDGDSLIHWCRRSG